MHGVINLPILCRELNGAIKKTNKILICDLINKQQYDKNYNGECRMNVSKNGLKPLWPLKFPPSDSALVKWSWRWSPARCCSIPPSKRWQVRWVWTERVQGIEHAYPTYPEHVQRDSIRAHRRNGQESDPYMLYIMLADLCSVYCSIFME